MKNFLIIFLLPIFFLSSCEKNNSFKKDDSLDIESQLEKEIQELSTKIENENYKNSPLKKEENKKASKKPVKIILPEKEDFSEKDLEIKNLNSSEDFSASLVNINNSNLENKCKSIKHKIFTFDKIEDGKCFLKSNKKITEKYGFFGVKIDFENGKFKNPIYYQCGFDYYSDGKICKKIEVDCGDDLKCLKFNIRKGVSIKYLENVKVPVPFVFMETGLIYKSKRIIKFSSKGFKDEFFNGFSDPGTCITVSSKCNKCTRKNRDDKFICTEAFCENEEFRCGGDNGDVLQDNGELKISFNENIGLEVVYDESYLNNFANKIKKDALEKNPNDKKGLEEFDRKLNEIKNNKKGRDDFLKENYKKDYKTNENQKHFCKFSSIFKVHKYIDKKQKELEKSQNGSFSFSTKDYGKLPEGASYCEGVGFEKETKSFFEEGIKIETKFDGKKSETKVCKNIGTRSEGWYNEEGKLIKYDNCGDKNNKKVNNILGDKDFKIKINSKIETDKVRLFGFFESKNKGYFRIDLFKGNEKSRYYIENDTKMEFEEMPYVDFKKRAILNGKVVVKKSNDGNYYEEEVGVYYFTINNKGVIKSSKEDIESDYDKLNYLLGFKGIYIIKPDGEKIHEKWGFFDWWKDLDKIENKKGGIKGEIALEGAQNILKKYLKIKDLSNLSNEQITKLIQNNLSKEKQNDLNNEMENFGKEADNIIEKLIEKNYGVNKIAQLKENVYYKNNFDILLGNIFAKGRTLSGMTKLNNLFSDLKQSDNLIVNKTGNIYGNPYQQYHFSKVVSFMGKKSQMPGLKKDVKKDLMVASWLRYLYKNLYSPEKAGFLFTKNLKQKIYSMDLGGKNDFKDTMKELIEVYWENGLKYGKTDRETFELIKNERQGKLIEEKDGKRFLGNQLVWIIEDGAWRLDEINF